MNLMLTLRRVLAPSLALACALTLSACAAEGELDEADGDDPQVDSTEQAIFVDPIWLIRAAPFNGARCAYGTFGCNACVPDVPARFNSASGSSDLRHRFYTSLTYSMNGPTPDAFHIKDHIQSIVRIPGLLQENWLAYSRNARDVGDAAFWLTGYAQIASHGDAWKWAYQRTESNPNAPFYSYFRIPGFNHAGGMQALGPMLFVAADCDEGHSCNAAVKIYDVRNPLNAQLINTLTIDGSRGELNIDGQNVSSRAAAVGAVRLNSGHTLLFVRGRQDDQSGWFYVSNTIEITPNTTWRLFDGWRRPDLPVNKWEAWENMNLLTDCNDGAVYAVNMGTQDNKSFLYKVENTNGQVTFRYVDARGLNTSGVQIDTRAGSSIHVTPNGNIVSYVTHKRPGELNEFRYHGSHGD